MKVDSLTETPCSVAASKISSSFCQFSWCGVTTKLWSKPPSAAAITWAKYEMNNAGEVWSCLHALCQTSPPLKAKEYDAEAAHDEAVNHQGLKSVSPSSWTFSLQAETCRRIIIVSSVQSPSSHLSTYPFPISTLSKIIIFILAASVRSFFFILFSHYSRYLVFTDTQTWCHLSPS